MPDPDATDKRIGRSSWLKGASWLTGGNAASMAISALTGILLVRALGPAQFGLYSIIVVAVGLGTTLVGFRLDLHLVSALRLDGSDEGTLARTITASWLLALPVCAGVLVATRFAISAPLLVAVLAVLETALAPVMLLRSVLLVQARQRAIVCASLTGRLAWALAIGAVVVVDPADALVWVFASRFLAAGLEALMLRRLANVRSSPLWSREVRSEIAVLRATAPLAAAGLAGVAYNRSDQMMLAAIRGTTETGIYAGGVRIAELLGVVAPIVQSVALPGIVELERRGDDRGYERALRDAAILMLCPAGLGVAILLSVGGPLAATLLGSAYADTGSIIAILAFAEWVTLLGTVVDCAALARNERAVMLWSTLVGLAVAVTMNLILIPRYGALAAAWASAAGYTLSSILPALRPRLRRPVLQLARVVVPVFGAIVFAGVCTRPIGSPLVAGALAAALYGTIVGLLFRRNLMAVVLLVSGAVRRRIPA